MWKNIYNQAELQIALDPKQGGLQGSSGTVMIICSDDYSLVT